LKDSWAKKENKNQPKQAIKEDTSIKEILVLTGKYLKSREEDERLSLIANVFELSKKVNFESLLNFIKTAESNKDFLTYLMMLNSKNIKTDFTNKANFELVNKFIGTALTMKNSYVRFQAVDCVVKYPVFKDNHLDLLKVMAIEDKNTHIIERLKGFL